MQSYLDPLFRSLGLSVRTLYDEGGSPFAVLVTDARENPAPVYLLTHDRAESYPSADAFLRGDEPLSILRG